MSVRRDRIKQLWSVYPSHDQQYSKWNENYVDKGPTEKLNRAVRRNFNYKGLSNIFVDVTKRTKTRFWYKVRSLFDKEELKVKVRLPEKPNVYYVNRDWYKTGDYFIDPVEIWWSQHGENVLKSWKDTCDIQHQPITNQQILDSIAEQYKTEYIEMNVNDTYGDKHE